MNHGLLVIECHAPGRIICLNMEYPGMYVIII